MRAGIVKNIEKTALLCLDKILGDDVVVAEEESYSRECEDKVDFGAYTR